MTKYDVFEIIERELVLVFIMSYIFFVIWILFKDYIKLWFNFQLLLWSNTSPQILTYLVGFHMLYWVKIMSNADFYLITLLWPYVLQYYNWVFSDVFRFIGSVILAIFFHQLKYVEEIRFFLRNLNDKFTVMQNSWHGRLIVQLIYFNTLLLLKLLLDLCFSTTGLQVFDVIYEVYLYVFY